MKWKTKDGKEVEVKDMTNSHVLNTHRYLSRLINNAEHTLTAFCDPFWGPTPGSMAEYYAEQEMDVLMDKQMNCVLVRNVFTKEIETRGLKPLHVEKPKPLPKATLVESCSGGKIYKLHG